MFFFRKNHIFYLTKPDFERFERSYFFSRIFSQVCYVQHFFEKNQYLFSKNPPNFSIKKPKFRTFGNFINSVEFYSISAKITVFINKQFFSKNPFYLIKKIRFWTLWGSWNFQSHFTANLLISALFKKIIFLRKPTCFFQEKPEVRTSREILLIQSDCTANLLPLAVFL